MTDDDPNEAYDIVPIPPGELMHSHGWVQLNCNGILQWIGTPEEMARLAADPEARKEARRSKMHHDRKPT